MVKINEKYYIGADSNCYTLVEKTTITDKESKNYGKENYNVLGYYSTLENCLNGLIKVELRKFISEDKEKSINQLLKKVKELKEYIENLKLDI